MYAHHALVGIKWLSVFGNKDYHGNTSCQLGGLLAARDVRWHFPAREYAYAMPGAAGSPPLLEFFFVDTTPWILGYRADQLAGRKVFNYDGVVDDVGNDAEWAAWEEAQLASLEAKLQGSAATWKVVVGHHPIRSAALKHGDQEELQGIDAVLRRHGVELYLNGHDHNLQLVQDRGVMYVTSGAGSKCRDAVDTGRQELVWYYDWPGFAVLTATEDELSVEFRDAFNRLLTTARIGA